MKKHKTPSFALQSFHTTLYLHFLHYDFVQLAVGCRPLVAPSDSYVEADGDHAKVQCNSSEESWHLNCIGTQWVGEIGNCTNTPLPGMLSCDVFCFSTDNKRESSSFFLKTVDEKMQNVLIKTKELVFDFSLISCLNFAINLGH